MYLAAGLPLTSFGRDKKAFQDYLCRGGKPVSFRYEGQDYAVTISNILRNYANSNRNKEQQVYQELKEYNFWRNLYGTKGIALVVYLLIIVREITLHGTIDIKNIFLNPYPDYVVLILMTLYAVTFVLFVNKQTVIIKAFDYAKSLIEVCERI